MLGAGLTRLAALSLAAVLLNLHYVLLGRPLLEALLTSRPVPPLGNAAGAARGDPAQHAAAEAGVPAPDRTPCVRYVASGTWSHSRSVSDRLYSYGRTLKG